MKKTITILSLLAASGVAFAGNAANANADLLYTIAANGLTPTTQDFRLDFTMQSLGKPSGGSGSVVNLGGGYSMYAQHNSNTDQYIGMRMNGADVANYTQTHQDATQTAPATNIYKVTDGTEAATNKPTDKVVGWVTHNASGNQSGAELSGASVSITSSSTAVEGFKSQIEISMPNGTAVNNVVMNQASLSLSGVRFASDALEATDIALTLGGTTYTKELSETISRQDITTVSAGNRAALAVFNFAIMPGTEVQNGDLIAAYYNSTQSTLNSNYFTLTKNGEGIFLTANMGTFNANTLNHTVYDGRTVTLGNALSICKEYTVIVDGAEATHTVYLFDDNKNLLSSATYTGTMNGSASTFATYMSDVYVAPEPATATLSLLALAGLCARRRRH